MALKYDFLSSVKLLANLSFSYAIPPHKMILGLLNSGFRVIIEIKMKWISSGVLFSKIY